MLIYHAQRAAAPLRALRIPRTSGTGDVVLRFSAFIDSDFLTPFALLPVKALLPDEALSASFCFAINRERRSAKTFVVWAGSAWFSSLAVFPGACRGASVGVAGHCKVVMLALLDSRCRAFLTSRSEPRLGFSVNWTGSLFSGANDDPSARGAHKNACMFSSLVRSAEETLSEILLSQSGAMGRFW